MKDLRLSKFIALLSRKCEKAGGVTAFARINGLPASVVSETLRLKREPSEAVANAAGCLRYTLFKVIRQ